MTREEHLDWCKRRARQYLDNGDVPNAITSMLSDITKHPETEAVAKAMSGLGMLYAMNRDEVGARRFIDGFN